MHSKCKWVYDIPSCDFFCHASDGQGMGNSCAISWGRIRCTLKSVMGLNQFDVPLSSFKIQNEDAMVDANGHICIYNNLDSLSREETLVMVA